MTGGGPPCRLVTLGAVGLTGPDRASLERIEAQPKRLALLAFLAARREGEGVSRDRVMITFWPEHSTDRAQGNLRNALYFLRRSLGADAVVTRGHTVSVSPLVVGCDAAELLGEPGRQSPEALLDLYRGEFLDALNLSDAPEYERWTDRTRADLRARAERIAWELSDEAEVRGEWITAARFARRAADLAVDVEAATQRLIRLLDRAGDRAAALTAYERMARELATDLGVSPSPESVELIEGVRSRETPLARAAGSPRPAVGDGASLPGRYRSLAILPFESIGDPEGHVLATGLSTELTATLSALPGVRVLSRTSVRSLAASPPIAMTRVHEELGADLVLEGAIRVHADRVRVTAHLVDAQRDENVWVETYELPVSDVFAAQSDVAIRVARALEVELSPREHRLLRAAPTRSAEAYRLYLRGRDAWSRRRPADASRAAALFEEAITLDPDFAAAWSGLADAYLVHAQTGAVPLAAAVSESRAAVGRALALDPASGEARATLGLILVFVDCDHAGGGRELRRAVELSPSHATARQWYGQWLATAGRHDEAEAQLQEALALDRMSPAVGEGLGLAMYFAGRTEEAERRFLATLTLDPEFARAHFDLALCRAAERDSEGFLDHLLRAWSAGMYGGQASEVEEATAKRAEGITGALDVLLERASARVKSVPMARMAQILLLVQLARYDEAVRALESARREGHLGFILQMAPALDPLRSVPAFLRLMREAGLRLPRWEG